MWLQCVLGGCKLLFWKALFGFGILQCGLIALEHDLNLTRCRFCFAKQGLMVVRGLVHVGSCCLLPMG